MKTSTVIVWNSRVKNLDFWATIISRVDPKETSFTVIHNLKGSPVSSKEVREKVEACGATYIPRKTPGMDIGAFQEVCRHRLEGFDYNYDFLIWFTDDCFPMTPDFAQSYRKPFSDPAMGLSCLEISSQGRRHVRTTGFGIRRAVAESLTFHVDPISTKEQCYVFEHRDKRATLYLQILAKGLKVAQIAPIRQSPVWDSGGGGHGWVNRREEFEKVWDLKKKGSKVLILATCFERFPPVVASFLAQTYHNWELRLIHNGPAPTLYPKFDDPRIIFEETDQNRGNFGHPNRELFLNRIRAGTLAGDYALITNDDNYHAPFFLEKLVRALDENPDAPGAYCSAMVHNYAGIKGDTTVRMEDGHAVDGYGVINVKPERGHMDVAGVLIRAEMAGRAGWPDYTHSSDWTYLDRVAQQNGGWGKFKVVPGVLLVHN